MLVLMLTLMLVRGWRRWWYSCEDELVTVAMVMATQAIMMAIVVVMCRTPLIM